MSKIFKVGIVGLLVVGALTAVMAGSALAQEPDPLDKPFGGFGGRGFGRLGGDRWAMFGTMAEAQGLTPDGVFGELHAGKSLEDGTISQEQADWMLEGLENGYWGGRGFSGHGFGKPGGFRGTGGFHHGPRDAGSQGVSGISL